MPQSTTTPATGDLFPDIEFVDPSGTPRRRSDITSGAPAVLFFLRTSTCPACLAHARTLARLAAAGELGHATVLLIAPGGTAEAQQLVARVPSDLVHVGATGTAHAEAGLARPMMWQTSGTFVLDQEGVVLSATTSVNPMSGFSQAAVLDALASLGSARPANP